MNCSAAPACAIRRRWHWPIHPTGRSSQMARRAGSPSAKRIVPSRYSPQRLRRLGLQSDTAVATQLANTVESVIALLGVLRARMIAAPLPLLWRRQDIVTALGRIDARAIVTAGRIDAETPAVMATEVAAELFPIRYIGAFGQNLPEGVVTPDDCFAPDTTDSHPHTARPGRCPCRRRHVRDHKSRPCCGRTRPCAAHRRRRGAARSGE